VTITRVVSREVLEQELARQKNPADRRAPDASRSQERRARRIAGIRALELRLVVSARALDLRAELHVFGIRYGRTLLLRRADTIAQTLHEPVDAVEQGLRFEKRARSTGSNSQVCACLREMLE
jgi:hypothetical protein